MVVVVVVAVSAVALSTASGCGSGVDWCRKWRVTAYRRGECANSAGSGDGGASGVGVRRFRNWRVAEYGRGERREKRPRKVPWAGILMVVEKEELIDFDGGMEKGDGLVV
jgi:hypothetical protein